MFPLRAMMNGCCCGYGPPPPPTHCTAVSHHKEQVSQVRRARLRAEGEGRAETMFLLVKQTVVMDCGSDRKLRHEESWDCHGREAKGCLGKSLSMPGLDQK